MPLNKLENFLKNVEGRILYVSPADLDSTDSILNQGNSQTKPFKTLQRALIEAARFSYNVGRNNDTTEKTTILLMPGEHEIDNRPGFQIFDDNNIFKYKTPSGEVINDPDALSLVLESNFDINQESNILHKFNSVNGGVIVPRGTSIVGLDLRKTKIRPKYVPNPTDDNVPYSALFRITGACYFWQFSIFDGDELGKVYTDDKDFSVINQSIPIFSHNKLTCFEYADGVNEVGSTGLTDLDMYYYKLSRAYNAASNRNIAEKFLQDGTGTGLDGFAKQRSEWEIVGAFANDPISITKIQSGNLPGVPSNRITVTTQGAHNLSVGTPIKITGVGRAEYNISTKVSATDPVNDNIFTYTLPDFPLDLETDPSVDGALITIETDTVSGASPYIFNISLRSVWGMNGMHADGSKASGFRSMVVAQFTGVSLQKDDRAFVKYNVSTRKYEGVKIETQRGSKLSLESSSTNTAQVYHLDSEAIYREGWQTTHVKITNNAILQIVSVFAIGYTNHFVAESGGDASITNSNSNFGQLALVSDGFRKDAFKKDDNAFITHIIAPKAIVTEEEDVEWVQIDVTKTRSAANSGRLYLVGFDSENIKPPSLSQGFRIGARNNDKLYVDINGEIKSADILMNNTSSSSARRSIDVDGVEGITGIFTTDVDHGFSPGEKVIIIADDGDLPEKILEHKVYFIISEGNLSNRQLQLALSKSDAENNIAIKNTYFTGTPKLKIISRVTDKESGDIGHPIQYDESESGWYIKTNANSDIFSTINPVSFGSDRTEITFFKRITDTRSLDDKIFKTRVSIPKEVQNGKDIQNGFVLQESSQTGVRTDGDLTLEDRLVVLQESDFAYQRNPRFISSCTFSVDNDDPENNTVTIVTEKPHNLKTGDLVKLENITDSSNTDGTFNKGYNIETTVTVPSVGSNGANNNNMKFTYAAPVSANPTNNFSIDKGELDASSIPRFTKKDSKANLYFYRSDVISSYDEGVETGVYHGYQLFADLKVPEEFTGNKYSQTVVDLYPQLDRDNTNDTPRVAKSFALRSPLGKVVTNDLQKSITKESIDKLLIEFGVGIKISSESDGTITLEKNHNLCGIAHGVLGSGNDSFTQGTYENVKIYENSANNLWNGTLAKVVVNSTGQISTFEITNPGSGFVAGQYGFWDRNHIGGSSGDAKLGRTSSLAFNEGNLTSSPENLVVQVTGSADVKDAYYRTTSVPQPNKIGIAKTSGDPNITSDQYVFIVGKAFKVSYVVVDGLATFTTLPASSGIPHGLKKGNRFQINDTNNNNLETLIVEDISSSSISKFTAKTNNLSGISEGDCYLLKHGLSANDGDSGKGGENLSVRGVQLYGFENAKLSTNNGIDATQTNGIELSLFDSQVGAGIRFPQGSYIQIDDEILRIASSTKNSTGSSIDNFTVIRGVFGTQATAHVENSLITKLNPIPLELHRYSILRASGHTFEYLGYGPGNYSTALPQVQVRTLTEREEFLSQAQERAAGSVVYTGMNDKGDFYIGNQKKSALTGEETTFDNPVPTVAGEDPSRLSVVFDEVTVKERLVVEGGRNNNILSQFDGPVTFSSEVTHKNKVRIKDPTDIEGGTAALKVTGGAIIDKSLKVDGSAVVGSGMTVTGISTFTSDVHFYENSRLHLGTTVGINDGFEIFENALGDARIKYGKRSTDNFIDFNDPATGSNISISVPFKRSVGISSNDGSKTAAKFNIGGATELYHDGTKKLETTGLGITMFDGAKIWFSAADPNTPSAIKMPQGRTIAMGLQTRFRIFENEFGNGIIRHGGNQGSGEVPDNNADRVGDIELNVWPENEVNIGSIGSIDNPASVTASFTAGAGCTFRHAGSDKFSTTGIGVTVIGKVEFDEGDQNAILLPQGRKIAMGTENRFQVFQNALGDARIKYGRSKTDFTDFDNPATDGNMSITVSERRRISITDNDGTNVAAIFKIGGATELYYDSTKRLETTTGQSGGVKVTGQLDVTADIVAYSGSDLRLKTDINSIADALNKVKSISGNTFEWNENSTHEGQDTGVIAQEIEALGLPGITKERDDGYLGVRYEKLVPLLIEAIKELSDKVDNLEQKLSDK